MILAPGVYGGAVVDAVVVEVGVVDVVVVVD
jgi:hypothetical protein